MRTRSRKATTVSGSAGMVMALIACFVASIGCGGHSMTPPASGRGDRDANDVGSAGADANGPDDADGRDGSDGAHDASLDLPARDGDGNGDGHEEPPDTALGLRVLEALDVVD